MGQKFKCVYFSDIQELFPTQSKSLTLAFSDKDNALFDIMQNLSSHEIREILRINSSQELEQKAQKEDLPINIFALRILRKKLLSDQNDGKIHPKFVTFKNSKNEPLQSWYSYLEGYSPSFVEYILDNFCGNVRVVYDPFSGTGTTPLVAAEKGLKAYYSEVNPLLQYLTEVKLLAKEVSPKNRTLLIDLLSEIKSNIQVEIENCEPDLLLREHYDQVFGKSRFFDEKTFDQVLRARTLIDKVEKKQSLAAKLLTVAIFSSLIPASLLQRSGDLRYKTPKEIENKKVNFIEKIKESLNNIIKDLYDLDASAEKPVLVSENAKDISALPDLAIDTVITSPPYLNGTNYFRNTKVELWFIRSLKSQEDLTAYRSKAVTAGINDVSFKKETFCITSSIEKVVKLLGEHPYDKRIPKMVMDYFQDMAKVFEGLKKHLKNNATLAIDIGDSIYGGVHVKTDELLKDVMESFGYEFNTSVILRKRISRKGEVLKQILLVFKYHTSNQIEDRLSNVIWQKDWQEFKNFLPHQKEPFAKRNWGHSLHSLCSYQGKMKPSLAHYLVKTFVPENGSMLDIFSGVGTIPFEAALNGRKSYGFDISPAAIAISRTKMQRPDKSKVNRIMVDLENYLLNNEPTPDEINSANSFGYNGTLDKYFSKETLREIVLARRYFSQSILKDASESLVLSCLLHILHGNRPYALSRQSHPITPFSPTGNFEYRELMPRLRQKVEKSLNVEYPDNFVNGEMYYQDATSWWPQEINDLDAIITSPPFFDSTRFYSANWMRLWFAGWNDADFKEKPSDFIDEKQKKDFSVYESILRQSRERLKKGGVLVFHLGKSKKCNMAEVLAQIAKKWFKVEDIFSENVVHCESHGIRDKGTVADHQYLVLS